VSSVCDVCGLAMVKAGPITVLFTDCNHLINDFDAMYNGRPSPATPAGTAVRACEQPGCPTGRSYLLGQAWFYP